MKEVMRRNRVLVGLIVAALTFGLTGAVMATDDPSHDDGTLFIGAPWGAANQDPADLLRVVVTYKISANGNIPASSVAAVQAAVDAWESAIDGRESGWDFDLVAFAGSPPAKPDIEIRLRKGGGAVAGQANSRFNRAGFRVSSKILISGKFFGTAISVATIEEIAKHELGHALSLGHHTNQNDLMGQTVGHTDGTTITAISACDLDGFEAAHHWLTTDGTTVPHLNHVGSIVCP